MKTILVGNDFSPAAQNACAYAMELAKAFNARLIMVHAYQPVIVPVMETGIDLTPKELIQNTKAALLNTEKKFNKESLVTVETHVQQGFPSEILLQLARETHAELIITGMKKGSPGLRKFFGSTVTDLVRKSPVPLLVVPEETPYVPVNTIALANDSDTTPETDVHLLDVLREVAERFHSRLYLVRVAENRFREAYEVLNQPFQLKRMLRTLDPGYEAIEGKNTTDALNRFIKSYHVNLLAMMPRRHSLPERLLYKSATRSMVFEATVPLLLLPYRHQ